MKCISRDEINQMDKRYRAQFINSLSGFKSVNLVGTLGDTQVANLSIVNSVIHLGANPPLMGFVMRPITVTRDTYNNIGPGKHFTFNHLTKEIYQQAHQTSARYDASISEFAAVGLTTKYSADCLAPYVKESPIQIGLTYVNQYPIQENGTLLIIGEIIEVHLPEPIIGADGFAQLEQVGSLTVSGLDSYHHTKSIGRLSYAKPDKPIEVISS